MATNDIKTLRWGILSTGSIAKTFARGLKEAQYGELVAVASRGQEKADAFAQAHGAARAYPDYQSLLDDPEVDAVYIATPHPMHVEWTIKAADAGKHVLCEKALTINWPDAQRAFEATVRNGVWLLEAFMYRCHPQTQKIYELVSGGELGEVRQIEATFAFQSNGDPKSRLLDLELGGGGILDVGCYTASFCRLVAGAAQGLPFADPLEVKALGKLGTTGADDYTTGVFTFPGGILAICSTGVQLNGGGFCRIVGSKANLRVPSPWFCGATDGKIKLILEPHGKPAQEIVIESPYSLYVYEINAMAQAVATGTVPLGTVTGPDALSNMKMLDRWRREIGLVYPYETPERLTTPASEEALKTYPNSMKYGSIAGVVGPNGGEKRISRIVLGTMLEGAINPLTHGLALFDDFYERGGTCFDTAFIYNGGEGERVLGHWLKTRGVRDEVTVLVKGAHPPNCTIEGMQRELKISLDRLGIESGDLYMMHRDNTQIPVSEWVDALNEEVRAGRFKVFGGSNWSLERIAEANEYAKSKGLQGFSSVSNNFSLARMVSPVWAGCISSSDAASRAWLTENHISLFAWSSQARGFFARGERDFTADQQLVRCWYSDDNFERLNRARELAARKGVSPVVIAAAYVLSQPFPIYALIGPGTLAETRDSMGCLDIELSPDEVAWLNLEE